MSAQPEQLTIHWSLHAEEDSLLVLGVTILVTSLIHRSVGVLEEVAIVFTLRVAVAVISFLALVNIKLANAFFYRYVLLLKTFWPEILVLNILNLFFIEIKIVYVLFRF